MGNRSSNTAVPDQISAASAPPLTAARSCSASLSTAVSAVSPSAKSIISFISNSSNSNPLSNQQMHDDAIVINKKIIHVAADFWNLTVNSLSPKSQLEIGVAIYLSMMVKDTSLKEAFTKNFNQQKVETVSWKFLNMMGWLIRALLRDDTSIKVSLKNLGDLHYNAGIRSCHFPPMLASLHETFEYYFPLKYRVQEKYAFNYIFGLSTHLMMNDDVIDRVLLPNDNNYLKSLKSCLKSPVGRQYLYTYLKETWCDEIALYLQAMSKFRNQICDKGRFIMARNIRDLSISVDSNFSINISYECRENTLNLINEYEKNFLLQQDFQISPDLFSEVDYEVNRLIDKNHWLKFVQSIKSMNI